MVLAYVTQKFLWRIVDFLRHWYVRSAKLYSNYVLDRLHDFDKVLAWRITLKNLFTPLYKDYTFVGYVLGFFLRAVRLLVASGFYAIVFFAAIALYVIWLLIPPVLVAVFLGILHV